MDATAQLPRLWRGLLANITPTPGLAATGRAGARTAAKLVPALLIAGAVAGSVHAFGAPTTTAGAERPLAATAQPDSLVRTALLPNDTFFGQLSWPAASSNLPAAWDATLGDPSIVIAVIDTGVSPVADLAGALVPGYDFIHNGTDTTDDNGHGTEVASVAAARTNNGLGIAGVCGRCSIMPVKVFDASGSGSSSTVAQGIAWAAAHGARIINLSAATPTDDPVLDAAISSAIAGGAVVVIAAGNEGSADPAKGGYPAAGSPDAIRVAGTDENGALFPWSNHGPWVDVAAPGSAAAAVSGSQYILGVQGTSVAAPFVAGIAGLLLSRDSSLQPAAVKTLITANGQPVAGLDVASGRRVDALASLVAAGYAPAPAAPAPAAPAPPSSPALADTLSASTTRPPANAAQAAPKPATAAAKRAPARPATPKPAVAKRATAAVKTPLGRIGCTATSRTGTMVRPGPTTSGAKLSCPAR